MASQRSITDTHRRCDALQSALGATFNDDWRFLPYIQRHEFETLVLAALTSLGNILDAEDDLAGLRALEEDIEELSPEDINDGEATSPSKRLLSYLPGYSKTLLGPLAIEDAGMATLRSLCPRFDAWLSQLEALSPN